MWNADPYLKNVFSTFIEGSHGHTSIANLIQYSPDIQRLFSKRIQLLQECPLQGDKVKNMQFCKPRFNSAQAPLSRLVLFFPAGL